MDVNCCVFFIILMSFLGVSIAQDGTTFVDYKANVPSGVVFWEHAPQSASLGNCLQPFIDRDVIKKHIKNCINSSKTEGSCQRSCGSYESFNITCKIVN
ncbi:hypothetical protein B566_EDAN016408, partial [Ephemera danica]